MTLVAYSMTGSLLALIDTGGGLTAIAGEQDCCCGGGGCCPETLIDGVTLDVEVTGATGGVAFYFPIGTHYTMTGGPIWEGESNTVAGFCHFQLICVDSTTLRLQWNQTACCPANQPPGTNEPNWGFVQISLTCDPFEAVFTWDFYEDPVTGCPITGLTGTLTVKVTIVP